MLSLDEMMGKAPDQAMRAFFTDLCRIRQSLPMEVWNLIVIVGSEVAAAVRLLPSSFQSIWAQCDDPDVVGLVHQSRPVLGSLHCHFPGS
jgi:hypothetical protein